jgi:hypothetical protein
MYVIMYVINFCCFNSTLTNKSHVSHVCHALWHDRNVRTTSFYFAAYSTYSSLAIVLKPCDTCDIFYNLSILE